ncbi:MAG: hypothetical protein GQ574_02605 [Crocinitomix sp.]|nr:hypothetical protein [Crocinitomix sp.]
MLQPFPYHNYRFGVFFLFPKYNFNGNFQSVSGLSFSAAGTDRAEGGIAAFKHKLTDQGTFGKLSLKRGFTTDSGLYEWCEETHNTMKAQPCNILVSLLDKRGMPVRNWLIFHAIPRGWTAGSLESSQSQILVESIDLSYQNFILI